MKDSRFTDRWFVVVTADQRHSRTSPDRVPEALDLLADLPLLLGPTRTAGDELQLLSDSPEVPGRVLERLTRAGGWRVGLGFGPVEQPLPPDVREARGPAFIAAREAVEAASQRVSGLAFATPAGVAPAGPVRAGRYAGPDDGPEGGPDDDPRVGLVSQAHAVAVLLQQVWSRRSDQGWSVIDEVERTGSGRGAAEQLGISASAVSQRLRAAGAQASTLGLPLLDHLCGLVLAATGSPS